MEESKLPHIRAVPSSEPVIIWEYPGKEWNKKKGCKNKESK